MPPPPLVFHSSTTTNQPDRYLSNPRYFPSEVPGVSGTFRQAQSQPIPIESDDQSNSYSLESGSHDSIMSDVSNSLRPSLTPPPPLTTATSSLPTPYTIRTPCTSTNTPSTRPIITSPTPRPDESMEIDDIALARVKPFPHIADPLGQHSQDGGSTSTSTSIVNTPSASQSTDEDMDIEEDERVEELAGREIEEEGTVQPNDISLRDPLSESFHQIGNSSSNHPDPLSPSYVYPQPHLCTGETAYGSRWSRPVPSREAGIQQSGSSSHIGIDPSRLIGSSTGGNHQSGTQSFVNGLGTSSAGDNGNSENSENIPLPYELAESQLSNRQSPVNIRPFQGSFMPLPGDWGEAYSSHAVIPHPQNTRSSFSNHENGGPSRIAPVQPRALPSSSSISSDFRTLPLPIANTGTGSPAAVERRLDNIEARLERARGRAQRSPPTPPSLMASLHSYEGIRNRSSASRPYDLSARSRPPTQIIEDGPRRFSFGRTSSVRPSWMEPSLSPTTTATVPPPRPRPATYFGWESDDTSSSVQGRPLSDRDTLAQRWSGSTSEVQDRGISAHEAALRNRSDSAAARYLQTRLNMIDNLRSGPLRPTSPLPSSSSRSARAIMPLDNRQEFALETELHQERQRESERMRLRSTNLLGAPPRSSRGEFQHFTPLMDDPHPTNEILDEIPRPLHVRPGNRRWMSFDEGERERENSRDRDRSRAEEESSLSALDRDVNEAIGRRLSQPRPRSGSISRRLRDHLGPDWEGTRLPDISSSSASSRSSRTEGLWGEVEASVRERHQRERLREIQIQINPNRNERRDQLDAFLALREHEERSRSDRSSPVDELAAFVEHNRRIRPWDNEDAAALIFERLRSNQNYDLDGSVDISDSSPFSFAYMNSLRRLHHNSTPSLHAIKLTDEMNQDEKLKVVKMIIKSITRLPSIPRKKAAETTLETLHYSEFDQKKTDDIEKDEYCPVCHDEYEDSSEIVITPCKHMYHQGCLNTWLNTPNTSSCPMCRRDLAALACLIKIVPTKKIDEALPLWMAAAL
ncbi:uncharacterized protein IL334_000216 [Kwoniella shivajii]|uniref:RING-type domain-containing protein n=1 Tax=Kwoniella shivajii TaxID=564305 RepID=A0ABZ1CNI9_9TREE|nr:hypothetical protein IL334_000216 [Kwoniella shivajii]